MGPKLRIDYEAGAGNRIVIEGVRCVSHDATSKEEIIAAIDEMNRCAEECREAWFANRKNEAGCLKPFPFSVLLRSKKDHAYDGFLVNKYQDEFLAVEMEEYAVDLISDLTRFFDSTGGFAKKL